jgi:hypothetical protein
LFVLLQIVCVFGSFMITYSSVTLDFIVHWSINYDTTIHNYSCTVFSTMNNFLFIHKEMRILLSLTSSYIVRTNQKSVDHLFLLREKTSICNNTQKNHNTEKKNKSLSRHCILHCNLQCRTCINDIAVSCRVLMFQNVCEEWSFGLCVYSIFWVVENPFFLR